MSPAPPPREARDRHLLIGAGFVGLGLARAMKARGIAYDHVEARDRLGGNWAHGVYRHVHIVSSKATTEYSDFPMPADYPDFPSAPQVLAYLEDFARAFDLEDGLEYGKAVVSAAPRPDERWDVAFADGEQRVYEGIVICNGHHWDARHPDIPGTFDGEYFHSKQYLDPEVLRGKRVLVIGAGNSACDIAVDAAREAVSSDISIRSSQWILPKSIFGRPLVEFMVPWIPVPMQRLIVRLILRMFVGRYADYGLPQPDHPVFAKHPTINSLLFYYLEHGVITPRPGIASWSGRTVRFTDGSEGEYDLVVAATGYHVSYPFLPEGLLPVQRAVPQIPMGTFHDRYKGLYAIGWNQPRLGVGPMVANGAPLICDLIEVQRRMRAPVGAVMGKLGLRVPRTHVSSGYGLLRMIRLGRPFIGQLPRAERLLGLTRASALETVEG